MKRMIKVIGILLVSAFTLLPLKTNAQEPVWTQELDLNDSVSSAIAKVEDGVVVMQYEGTASASNLLIKYDFNGKKIWEIDNDYGYNIESVSDGFIVWSETKITKFDKDKNILWSKDIELHPCYDQQYLAGLGNKLIEFNDGYIIGQTSSFESPKRDFFKMDLDGNIVKRISAQTLVGELINSDDIYYYGFHILGFSKSLDGKSIVLFVKKNDNGTLIFSILDSNLTPKSTCTYKSNDLLDLGEDKITNVIETNNGYVVTGQKIIIFNKQGEWIGTHSKTIFDIVQIGDYIYAYLMEKSDSDSSLNKTSLVKYDQDFNEISNISLSYSFHDQNGIYNITGSSQIKNRFVYYKDTDSIHFIVLNTPVNWVAKRYYDTTAHIWIYPGESSSNLYNLVNYRFSNDKEETVTNSNIINTIIKNPQTNSIIIITILVLLILAISIISYVVYQKKTKNKS